MINLSGEGGELHFTIQIKRAETGKVETHELVGKIISEEDNGGNALDRSA